MKKIKICHVTSAHNATDTRILHKECFSLAKNKDYEVILIAEGNSRIINNVEIVGLGEKPTNRLNRIFLFSKRAFEKAKIIDADVYHLHDPELLPYASKLKKMGKIVIFDAHENYEKLILEKKYINKYFRSLFQYMFNWYYKKIIKKIDSIIGVTPNIEMQLRKISKNVCIITNYPILKDVKYCNVENDNENLILSFAGGINKDWCHDKVIKIIQNIDDVAYKLIGFSKDNYYNELMELDLSKKVEFMGRIDYEDVFSELSRSDIGLALLNYSRNTFYEEGTMGNTKIFEEMAAGLPIICTNFSLWKETIIDKYNCGICVNPNDKLQIKKAIELLRDDSDLRKKMGNNSRKAAFLEFNWSTQEIKLLELYRKVIYEIF